MSALLAKRALLFGLLVLSQWLVRLFDNVSICSPPERKDELPCLCSFSIANRAHNATMAKNKEKNVHNNNKTANLAQASGVKERKVPELSKSGII